MRIMPLVCFRGWNFNPGTQNFKKRPSFEMFTLCSHPHVLDLFKVSSSQMSHFTESHMEGQLHKTEHSVCCFIHVKQFLVAVVQR